MMLIRHSEPPRLIAGQLATSRLADQITALSDTADQALVEDITHGRDPLIDDLGVAIPFQTDIVTAAKPA